REFPVIENLCVPVMIYHLLSIFLLLGSVVESRVAFEYSEVLQATDLGLGNRAPFKCENGCQVYTDASTPRMFITEYNEKTKAYEVIDTFSNVVAPNAESCSPYNLEASKNYFIENRGDIGFKKQSFVFYAVDNNAPDIDTTVLILSDKKTMTMRMNMNKLTTIRSNIDAVTYTNYEGSSLSAGPRIYATGFDAVDQCHPLYTSRTLESVSASNITVFSPISTIDFGIHAYHQFTVAANSEGTIVKSVNSSFVYSSAGYVGCENIKDQSYTSSSNNIVQDQFSFEAISLEVNADLFLQTPADALNITVNGDKVILFGFTSKNIVYHGASNALTTFDVDIRWTGKSANANFAVQFDFSLANATTSPVSSF
ncbi:hypothetical protein PENTCL1PPCAC_21295, partial [Pristionchus entomophagus]